MPKAQEIIEISKKASQFKAGDKVKFRTRYERPEQDGVIVGRIRKGILSSGSVEYLVSYPSDSGRAVERWVSDFLIRGQDVTETLSRMQILSALSDVQEMLDRKLISQAIAAIDTIKGML